MGLSHPWVILSIVMRALCSTWKIGLFAPPWFLQGQEESSPCDSIPQRFESLSISVPEEAIYIMRSSDVKEEELVLSVVVVVHAYTKSYMESIYR